jgi:phage terminase large subunit
MISIPNHTALIADLSLPMVEETETGKNRLEAKSAMRRRQVKSPDYGDALAYSFAPARPDLGAGYH